MEIALPARFEDLTLGQYIAIKTQNDPVKVLAVVSGMAEVSVRKLPSKVFDRAIEHIGTLCDTEVAKHQKVITLNGTDYGFIPDWSEFTTGEWIDMENHSKDMYTNADKIMALLYRKITRRFGDVYEIEPYTAKEDHAPFRQAKAELYAGVLLFFSTTKKTWLNTTIQSLAMTGGMGIVYLKNGGGTTFFSRWQGRMFYVWKQLRNFQSK